LDTEFASLREKERLKRLEEQIEDMLANGRSLGQLIMEVDWHTFSDTKLETIQVLLDIKDKQPFKDNKRLQKLISHYAIERDGMVILKP
jgi:hypothetical protein